MERSHRARTGVLIAFLATLPGCSSPPELPPAEWEDGDGFRSIRLTVHQGKAGFASESDTGIDFFGLLSDSAFVENRHRVNGAGVALGDVDGDGRPDIFLAGLEAPSRLYRNLGDWRFQDITEEARVSLAAWYTTGAAFLDAEGDGDMDLVVTALDGPSQLLLNNGQGRFSSDPNWPGLALGPLGGTSIAAADVDGDTDLDIYVTNYKRHTVKDLYQPDLITFEAVVTEENGAYRVRPPFDAHYRVRLQGNRLMRYEYAEPDVLFRNEGDHYVDGTLEAFPELDEDWGLGAQFRDHDGDGDPDLYVANDFESPDLVWINTDGRFRRAPTLAFRHTSQSSMAVDGSDVDRDGDVDLFVTEMLSRTHSRRLRQVGNPPPIIPGLGEVNVTPQVMHNTLQMAVAPAWDPAPRYAEAAWAYEVAASEWSWTALFMDVDLDGWEDLLVSTGHRYDAMDLDAQMAFGEKRTGGNWTEEFLEFPDLDLKNVAFRNVNGARFEDMADGWGMGAARDVTHGMAAADLDGDGDLDLVTNRLNGPAGVFRNTGGAARVAVRLRGQAGNTAGIGGVITLSGGGMDQQKEILAGGYYLSGGEPLASFAALADTMTLTVRWRSGHWQTLRGVTPNRLYEVFEPAGPAPEPELVDMPPPHPFLETELATHYEAPFEDRARQPLLTRRLSQEGPFVALGDLNGDGVPDAVIGAGHAGRPGIYLSQDGRLAPFPTAALPTAVGDWAGLAITRDGLLAVAVSGYETDRNGELLTYRLGTTGLEEIGRLDLGPGSPGAVIAADFIGNGVEELFVAMRFLPNRYPESVSSLLLGREAGGFVQIATLPAGMVTGAGVADADGDGDLDLATSSEWGSVRLFLNDGQGRLTDASQAWGLSDHKGLWRGVAWGDVNADGRPDLVATNWGWNSPFGRIGAKDYSGRGLRLYHGDLDRNGSVDPVEAEYAPEIKAWAPLLKRMDLVRGLRYVSRRSTTAMQYAASSIQEILGQPLEVAGMLPVSNLGHTVWINRGGRFEPVALPEVSQWAPATGVLVADLNHDSNADILMAQNFFPVLPEDATRQDAGSGLVLFGDGTGAFSGAGLPLGRTGDGRAVTLISAGDRPQVILTQNAAPAWLFEFVVGSRPGS